MLETYTEKQLVQVAKYQATYPDELGIVVGNNQQQKDVLDLILLDFRKLREGIISSSRADDFAVEVYETSTKLALLDKNIPQIASILPHLVKTLHKSPRAARHSTANSLEAGIQQLKIIERSPISPDTKARFLSYYLLHLICHMEDTKAFQHLLKDMVHFSWSYNNPDKIPCTNPHITFAMQVFHCFIRNDYASMAKITFNPRSYDKFAWVIVRSAQNAFQARAGQTLKSSYMVVEDKTWLARQLQLDNEASLPAFLKKEDWSEKVNDKGAILLKKG